MSTIPTMTNEPINAGGGGFLDELLSLGGTLAKEGTLAAVNRYNMRKDLQLQNRLLKNQEAAAQPEVQRTQEPAKGVNENGQTIAQATPNQAQSGDKVLFAGITQKQAVIGSVAIVGLGIVAYMVKG